MFHSITERVLEYEPALYEAWKAGDKSLIPSFVRITPDFENQSQHHFGEMFALRWYHNEAGWRGGTGRLLW
jgi:hypothetical protein